MKKWNATAMFTLTSALALTVLAGCGATSGGTASTNNTTGATASSTDKPTLIMATSADYKPYEYHDTSSGQDKIVGFDIDIANEIAKELNFNMKVEDMDFNGLIGALQAKRADFVIAGMTPTAKRKESVDFSDIYYQAQNAIISKKGSAFTTPDSLKGHTVAAQLGSIQEGEAKKISGAKVDSLNTIPTVVQEVVTGRADGAIVEGTVAKGYVDQNPNLQMNLITADAANGSAIAFPKGSPWVSKFNTVIAHMKADGQMQQLINKWFGSK